MNRGHSGEEIFYGNKNKSQFLDFLVDATKKLKIRIFAYCLMDNHYHLVLENSSGKMSEYFKPKKRGQAPNANDHRYPGHAKVAHMGIVVLLCHTDR